MNKTIEVVLPVYNEEVILEKNFLVLRTFLEKHKLDFIVTIIDNDSTDKTFTIAKDLESRFLNTLSIRLNTKGRGRALRLRLCSSSCFVVGYMDIDLSANLNYFLEMYNLICSGCDIVIGSRLIDPFLVTRSFLRKSLSKVYSKLVRIVLKLPFFDYQCGCKIFNRGAVFPLLSYIKDDNWFFDTEMLFYAHKFGLKVREIPLIWKDRKTTKVNLPKTIIEDCKGIARLRLFNEL